MLGSKLFDIPSYVHPFICIRECLFQRVNVSACGEGLNYLSVLLFDRTNVTIQFCVCFSPSVNQIVQSNFSGSNTFGTMKISSRQG